MKEDSLTRSERRAEKRCIGDVRVSLGTPGMPALPVTALNVSASGMYCICPTRLGDLTRVDVHIKIDEAEIEARAVVIREEEQHDGTWGVGLFYTRISLDDRKLICDLVDGNRL
jgi:hypothetical protein